MTDALSGCHTGQLRHHEAHAPAGSLIRSAEGIAKLAPDVGGVHPSVGVARLPADQAQRRPVARQERVDENIGPPEYVNAERVVVTDRHRSPWSAVVRLGSNESARCAGATPLHHGSLGRDSAAAPARAQTAHGLAVSAVPHAQDAGSCWE